MVFRIGVIVNKGFEHATVQQIRESIEGIKDIRVEDTIVIFEANDWNDVQTFIYKTQIANRVIYLLDEIEFKDDDELVSKVGLNLPKDDFLKEQLTKGVDGFRVSVASEEHMDVTSTEADIGGVIIDYARVLGADLKVNLSNPILNIYVHNHNSTAYVGVDLSGDLTKRDYKIFNNAVSLKGTTAFGLLMIAGYKPEDVFMNPYCYSGTIEIEAALYSSQISPRFYNKSFPFMKLPEFIDTNWDKFFEKIDKTRLSEKSNKKLSITGADPLLSSITAATKNAKIAGVGPYIDFRRIDTDWLELKFEEKSVDKIITFHPGSSKYNTNSLIKNFHELFYNAEYILKDTGSMVVMCLSKDLLIQESLEYFELDHELSVHSGGQFMHILFFRKRKR